MRWLWLWCVLFVACGGSEPAEDGHVHEEGEEVQLWTCGMHPEVIQDHPGQCPICGMDLVPLREGPGEGPTVYVDGVVQQHMNVRIEPIERTTIYRHLRTIGQVEVGESEVSVVNLRFSGWVERIRVDRTGDPVKRGQTLFEIYSPDLVAAQEELLLAARTQGPDSALAKSARRKLELWDVAGADIDEVVKQGQPMRTVPIRAPRAGFVLHKEVVEGARVQAGRDLYRIGDLKRIWVTAEVYEFDAPWVEVGQAAQLELPYQAGEVLEGQVSYIYPTLDTKSRTLTVRLEFDNPGINLKPGMFATVYIQFRRVDDVLAVPTEAILHSGTRQLVWVSDGAGMFEAREVVTGLVGDRRLTEVVEGVAEGEEVVVSGQFLIDSESQLQEAIQKMMAKKQGKVAAKLQPTELYSCPMHPEVVSDEPGRCPECGMDLVLRDGSPEELEKLYTPKPAQPGQYTCPMHPEVVSDEPGRCGVCGMFLEKVE